MSKSDGAVARVLFAGLTNFKLQDSQVTENMYAV